MSALKSGNSVLIRGDVGGRLGSSMGVDLMKFGGTGKPIKGTGTIVVDGDVGPRLGISMLRGNIYVSGQVKPPQGNVIEVESDKTGYRKFLSISEILETGGSVLYPNLLDERGLILDDGVVRETLAARNSADKLVLVKGDVGMSAGILMSSGTLDVCGDAGRNTGVLLSGGRVVVKGICDDFTAAEMRCGKIFVEKDAGNYICAKMKGGTVYAPKGKVVPPATMQTLKGDETGQVSKVLGINALQAMMFKKFCL